MKKCMAIFFTALLISAMVGPATLLADKDKHDGVKDALEQGADRLLSLQGNFSGIENGWEWIAGSGNAYWNTQGIAATGLVAAYEKIKDRHSLAGAIAAGDTLVKRYETLIADGVVFGDRPYSTYIEFLVWLSQESRDHKYAEVAVKWYALIPAFETAEELVNRYITVRKSLAGWDLASQIRGPLAVGNKVYAKAVAAELIRRKADWVHVPLGGWDYTTVSYASLLWALDQLDGDDNKYKPVIDEFRGALLALQEADGSWEDGEYQATAYAILGLSSVKGKGVKEALSEAGSFLVSSQAENGGWVYSDGTEYGEDDSEVLMALAGLLKGGDITNIHKVKLQHKERGEHREKHKHMR